MFCCKLITRFFLVLSLVFSFGCGSGSDNQESVQTLQHRVINGKSLKDASSFPVKKIVSRNSKNTYQLCSAALIGPQHLLTAAHCFVDEQAETYIKEDGQYYEVLDIVIHPDYYYNEYGLFNDVAIIHSAKEFASPYLPLLLSQDTKVGDLMEIYGYGVDENREVGILKQGDMIVDNISSNHIFSEFKANSPSACNGDSGGPALYQIQSDSGFDHAIVGVISSSSHVGCVPGSIIQFINIQNSGVLDFVFQMYPEVAVK